MLAAALLVLAGTAGKGDAAEIGQRHPDVLQATARARGDGGFDFEVTIFSPYDTPQRYADGFRVVGPDGTVYGERPLAHDHQHEQPFTRALDAVRIPAGVRRVVVQARDRRHGYGGRVVALELPGR